MILGTAGHIDHGKTSLVRALTGVDTDRLPEEKKRGITIELGFAPLELEGVGTVGVVDVPGHEAFVRTMVAGATGIDLALLVVAADEGVMPQTREHLAILELLGVRSGVIALTKADLVDEEWLALVEEDVREASRRALPDAPIITTSIAANRGVPELRSAIVSRLQSLPAKRDDDLFRLPVDRVFTIKGTGTVVTGTVWSGRVSRDENVRILPGTTTARVRGIQGHGAQLDTVGPGGRTAVALASVEVADIPRGSTLVTDRDWQPTKLLRADLTLVPGMEVELRPRTWFRFHVGTSEVGARVVTREVLSSGPFAARIVLDEPVILRAGDRFVLRSSAPLNTIAGGIVADPYAARRARLWRPNLSTDARLAQMAEESGGQGIDPARLPVRLGLTPRGCHELVADSASLSLLGGRVLAREVVANLEREALTAVERFHDEQPLEPGAPAQTIRTQLRALPAIAEAVVDRLISSGRLSGTNGVVALEGWVPNISDEAKSAIATILQTLEQAGIEPPTSAELAESLGPSVDAILRFLERRGDIVQVDSGRYYTTGNLKLLIDRLRGLMAGGKELTPAEARDGLGLSRKYLIPFLEYCDRVGYTNRNANGRVWKGP
jgi:selenocysteine-specific elongation factor